MIQEVPRPVVTPAGRRRPGHSWLSLLLLLSGAVSVTAHLGERLRQQPAARTVCTRGAARQIPAAAAAADV